LNSGIVTRAQRELINLHRQLTSLASQAAEGSLLVEGTSREHLRKMEADLLDAAKRLSNLTSHLTSPRGSSEIPSSPEVPRFPFSFESYIARIEKDLLCEALEQAGGVQTRAAKLLQINLRSFRYLLDKYGLK